MSTAELPELLDKLPHVPSQLIRLAIRDIKRVKESPDMEIDMGTWHEKVGGKCLVCFAGAVMHFGLKPPEQFEEANGHNIIPGYYSRLNAIALRSLDDFRSGWVADACEHLGAVTDLDEREISDPECHFNEFITDMEKLAADLEAEGN